MIKSEPCRVKMSGAGSPLRTAEPAVSFYRQSGFVPFRTDPGFFTRMYPEPIYDGDFLCEDMIYLRRIPERAKASTGPDHR